MKSLIKKNPIWSFLLINYVISWSFLYPSYELIKQNDEITPLALIGLIGAYGPTIAAIIVQSILDKRKLKTLLKKLIQIRSQWKILLFVSVVPIILYAIAYLISALIYNGDFSVHWLIGFSNLSFWFLVALPFGPMGEELGWRGFLLPKLLERFSLIKSTILVGLAWGGWHLASFSFPGAAIPDFLPVNFWSILLFCVNTVALSMVYTYVHLKTNGSVFMAIILHAFFNAAANIVFDFFSETENFAILFSTYCLNIVLAGFCGYLLIKKESSNNYIIPN